MLRARKNKSHYTQRQRRVGELIKKCLSEFIQRDVIHDEDLFNKTITITQVVISADLKNATAFVIPLGGENTDEIVIALNNHAKYIRGQITSSLSLKHTPKIDFKEDISFKSSSKIDTILKKIASEIN
tara:strand:- start:60025 stop:60408 length:384 start_codon:yes stop_codon:yes gene_type:complete